MHVEVALSPQFDLCFALADLASPNPHFAGWPGIDDALVNDARSFGWVFWLGVPDLLDLDRPLPTSQHFIEALAVVVPDEIVPRLHRSLVQQPTSRFANARSREWLHFIGLDNGTRDPSWASRWNGPMDAPLAVLEAFQPSFDQVWNALQRDLENSARQARKIADQQDFAGIVEQLAPDIEFDEIGEMMHTAKGYNLPLADVATMFLLPSAFNSRRFKTLSESGN